MNAENLTDAEVDKLLERFDQTDPSLQRRIVAQFVIDAIVAQEAVKIVSDAYNGVMDALKRSRMPHGDCKSGKRYGGIPKACTACMANRKLDEALAAYKGRPVTIG